MKEVLIVFVKNPVAGKVKTRLAADIGDEAALKAYKKLLLHTQVVLTEVEAERQIWFSDEVPDDPAWGLCSDKQQVQSGDDLGARMLNAFKQAFDEGADRVVIIGSDCAGIRPGHIQHALFGLEDRELVIGPAKDGGYYLLGMSDYFPELFEDISWSTDQVREQTLQKADEQDLDHIQLETLSDVDTLEDWNAVKDDLLQWSVS